MEIAEVAVTPDYWDCECEDHFIHPKDCEKCLVCGAIRNEQPDSRVNEVRMMNKVYPNSLGHICNKIRSNL